MRTFKWLLTHYKAFQSFIFSLLLIYIFTHSFKVFLEIILNLSLLMLIQGHFLHLFSDRIEGRGHGKERKRREKHVHQLVAMRNFQVVSSDISFPLLVPLVLFPGTGIDRGVSMSKCGINPQNIINKNFFMIFIKRTSYFTLTIKVL